MISFDGELASETPDKAASTTELGLKDEWPKSFVSEIMNRISGQREMIRK